MKLTQPGLQEVIIGSLPPLVRRSMNSLPSSRMVRSAVKSVSNTLSKPIRRRAATILPVTMLPDFMPRASPRATRTAGAVCTTTCFFGSLIACQTTSVSSFSTIAPVGQTVAHWPQYVQGASSRPVMKAGATVVPKPRLTKLYTCTPWRSLQARMQRPQRMHLFWSRTSDGLLASMGRFLRSPSKGISRMPRSAAMDCSSQLRLRWQDRQSFGWLARRSSTTVWRASRTALVFVRTTMPSLTG